jgi:hypothetical protein
MPRRTRLAVHEAVGPESGLTNQADAKGFSFMRWMLILKSAVPLLCASTLACGEAGGRENEFAIGVKVYNSEVLIAEPVVCRVELKNNAGTRVRIQYGRHSGYDGGPSLLTVWVMSGQKWEREEAWEPGFRKAWKSGFGPLIPASGDFQTHQIILGSKDGSLAFSRNRKYWIRVRVAARVAFDGGKTSDKKIQEIVVEAPDRQVDKRMLEEIHARKEEYIELVQAPWYSSEMTKKLIARNETFEELAEEHPQSTYSPYILFSIGRHHEAIANELSNNIRGVEGQTEKESSRIARSMQRHAEKALKFWGRAKKLFDRRRLEQFVAGEIKAMRDSRLMR